MYNQDPRALGDLGATWDFDVVRQINRTINTGADGFQINRGASRGGILLVTTLDRLGMAAQYLYNIGYTDGSVQQALAWMKNNSELHKAPDSNNPAIISQAKYDHWMGYVNAYFTALWYKNNPGQPVPPGGVPTPKITQGNILEQIIAWLKGQGTTTTTTTPTITNAGFLGTYGIPIMVLVGGIAILGFAFAPKKGAAPATVPLVKPTIRYRYRAKRRR